MEVALGILLAVAVLAALVLGLQLGPARAASSRALSEVEGVRKRLAELETDSKKASEALEAKRRENDELKERLKDVKKRRHDERETARLKKDIDDARAEIEREMEKKLAQAREEAEVAKASLKKLTAEVEALRSRKPAPEKPAEKPAVAEQAAPAAAAPAPAPAPAAPRPPKPEEVARAEAAEKALAKARAHAEELDAEVKRLRGRAETDRRVFVVQKGEIELAKDKYRALESRHNALSLERDELRKSVYLLEKELKSLRPVAEPAPAKAEAAPARPEEPKAEKPADAQAAAPAAEPMVAAAAVSEPPKAEEPAKA